jgi:dolichol-phosphate mannosyltransferase
MLNKLWIIMPVYNEQECVGKVIDEWMPMLEKSCKEFTFLAINDGSKDKTLEILNSYAKKYSRLKILDKPNSGHGQSCLVGYRMALKEGADWIFQIDSDGQCEPKFFESFAKASVDRNVIYGYRKTRDDGMQRLIISRFVSVFTFFATGVWVRDGNVPYRLMHRNTLKDLVDKVPSDFHLSNILISAWQEKLIGISWINIHFRNRMGGVASVKTYSFAKHGFRLFKQLKKSF